LHERLPAEPADRAPSRGSKWLWIGAAVLVVAAGAVGGWLAFGRSQTDVPASTLGHYKF
jgi:Tfp pilus assembly protein PilN